MRMKPWCQCLSFVLLMAGPSLAHAADDPWYLGTWTITSAIHAPWEDPANPIIDADEATYLQNDVTFAADSLTGPGEFSCRNGDQLNYVTDTYGFDGLFEGGLGIDPKDPTVPSDLAKATEAAHKLGFTATDVATLATGCSEVLLHQVTPDRMAFGLNDRVFYMDRKTK